MCTYKKWRKEFLVSHHVQILLFSITGFKPPKMYIVCFDSQVRKFRLHDIRRKRILKEVVVNKQVLKYRRYFELKLFCWYPGPS